jgi:molybdenum cofactor sulfurtransferase
VTLVAYPAQSNLDGQRYALTWSEDLRRQAGGREVFTLLDVASLVSTSPLDLSDSETAPDFTVLSFYKIFGFPDLGALLVRRQAECVFDLRRYFGGGTVDMVVCHREQWHAPKTQFLHERLEDGTLPVHSIIALDVAMDVHTRLFASMHRVAQHTTFLTHRLKQGLQTLKHGNGSEVCIIYSDDLPSGPVVAFNMRNASGAWVSLAEFEKLASSKNFHVRTGGVCNPGGIASALGLEPWEIKRNFSAGFRCGSDNDIVAGKPTGVIRASLGAMSTISDVERFVAFLAEFYCDRNTSASLDEPATLLSTTRDLKVHSITVYPIKSCGGYEVPTQTPWEIRPEGLAWDREWCLLHRGTGQALSQKRHPKMALIRPTLDFGTGCLNIGFAGYMPDHLPRSVSVPLSNNPALFESAVSARSLSSRVCGEEISAQTYLSEKVNKFFSAILDVPCVLARFPPGGQGPSMRHSKAHLQKHQLRQLSEAFPTPPSPPDSDSESLPRRILLSNESPILVVNLSSLDTLNKEIRTRGGSDVSAAVFRANIIVGGHSSLPYEEDNWTTLRIGRQNFRMLGSCRRCHMVCINQQTAKKSEEPFVTLAKTRRFDGKVFFGNHMGHDSDARDNDRDAQFPTITVGDVVRPDAAM